MNDPEIIPPNDLAGQVAALQRQVFTLLLALIVVSGTLAVYLSTNLTIYAQGHGRHQAAGQQ